MVHGFTFYFPFLRSSHRKCSVRKDVSEISQNLQENTCARASFLIKLQASGSNFTKKETLAQVFSCELCEIFKNDFFVEHLRVTATVFCLFLGRVYGLTIKHFA